MKKSILERVELLKALTDEYTRNVSEFAEHGYGDDWAGHSIDRNSGFTRNQLHEQAKAIRRVVLQLDKDTARDIEAAQDREGLGR